MTTSLPHCRTKLSNPTAELLLSLASVPVEQGELARSSFEKRGDNTLGFISLGMPALVLISRDKSPCMDEKMADYSKNVSKSEHLLMPKMGFFTGKADMAWKVSTADMMNKKHLRLRKILNKPVWEGMQREGGGREGEGKR